MFIQRLKLFLGIKNVPPPAQGLMQKFFLILSLQTSFFLISRTFYVLFVIDLVGFEALGVFLAVSVVLQAVIDYPSGSLGDWIGQKWVLTIAYVFYAISYGLLIFANSFLDVLLVYLISTIASSQESGTLQSWFDNNYRVLGNDIDPSRNFYQEFQGKTQSVIGLLGACMFLIGATIATITLREIVFLIQAIGMCLVALFCIIFLNDFPNVAKTERTFKNYFSILKNGIRFTFSSKQITFLIMGICFWNCLWKVLLEMILFPIYFGYTGSDAGAGVVRFIIWIFSSFSAAKAGVWSKRFNIRKWLPRFYLLTILLFFGFFASLTTVFPLEDRFSILPVLSICLFSTFSLFIVNLYNIMKQRLLLDLIPNSIRNSMYSIIPTITLLLGAPLFLISGYIIESSGVSTVLLILMFVGILSSALIFYSFYFEREEDKTVKN